MKKRSIITMAMFASVVAGLMIINACSKESNENPEKQNEVFQPSEKDLQIESKILAFKEKIEFARENPNLKSGEDDLTVDEAIWNIEALANYNYADASTNFDNYISDTTEIVVPLTNGEITLNDAGIAYEQIIDSLSVQYANIAGDNKQLMIADISLKSIEGENATFDISSSFGDGDSGSNPSFGENDYWWYGMADYNLGGYCDGPYSGTHTDSDAAEQIQRKTMMRRSLPSGHNYFIDIKEVYVVGNEDELIYEPNGQNPISCYTDLSNPNDPVSNDNYYDRLVYYNWEAYQNFHGCLEPSEMNFYLNSMEDIIYNKAYDCFPNELSGKIFANCDMYWGLYNYNGAVQYYHTNLIHYGISVGSNDPPNEL